LKGKLVQSWAQKLPALGPHCATVYVSNKT
jgi:hypothetical protein